MSKSKKDKVEELPIEEFENDKQDTREEFLKKFGNKTESESKEEKK